MKLKDKLSILQAIYDIYDRLFNATPHACQKFCSSCCTVNVTMTSLEGMYILHHIPLEHKHSLYGTIKSCSSPKRYQPKLTLNGFAESCMAGIDIPDEENDPSWGKCPLLLERSCTIYDYRPMACRIMMSKSICDEHGCADMDELTITLNNIFLQYAEHIDEKGFFGNLTDILLFLDHEENGLRQDNTRFSVIKNRAAPFLMIPPEHRKRIVPIIEEIQGKIWG
ncbi:MAG: YkgJ family cysteine cluster protein [Proteobacteria bacterium]|nr:YkgJ family cysteine cluster protein [Pseudomonadota bacterium]